MEDVEFSTIAAVASHAGTVLAGDDPVKSSEIEKVWAAGLRSLRVRVDAWSACYMPGYSFNDAQMFAVHAPTGRVVGLETGTEKRRNESTEVWIARVS